MKFKISLFSAIALIVLTIGTNQIIKADAINSSDDTTQTTPIKGVIGSKGLGEDGKTTWTLDSNGVLTISGGIIDQYDPDDGGLWENYGRDIKKLISRDH